MRGIEDLVAAVIAFLDTDAAFGPVHVRTDAAKTALQRTVSTVVAECNAVDLDASSDAMVAA